MLGETHSDVSPGARLQVAGGAASSAPPLTGDLSLSLAHTHKQTHKHTPRHTHTHTHSFSLSPARWNYLVLRTFTSRHGQNLALTVLYVPFVLGETHSDVSPGARLEAAGGPASSAPPLTGDLYMSLSLSLSLSLSVSLSLSLFHAVCLSLSLCVSVSLSLSLSLPLTHTYTRSFALSLSPRTRTLSFCI